MTGTRTTQRKAPERGNQQYRTRKDLLAAAGRLIREGRKPSMEEVAEAARVSRATAYRYFPKLEVLLAEAAVHIVTPDADELFAHDESDDAEARLLKVEAALRRTTYDNEATLRVMLSSAVLLETQGLPVRQNRRLPLIEAALAPVRDRIADYDRLCRALCLVLGTESMIVSRDVLRIDEDSARDAAVWAVRALLRAALDGAPAVKAAAAE